MLQFEKTIKQLGYSQKESERVNRIEYLVKSQFVKLGSIRELIYNGFTDIPQANSCGIYAITKPPFYNPEFLSQEKIKKNRNVIGPWDSKRLSKKWVDNADILYYGLAGATSPRWLNSRLTDLINHCKGLISNRGPHRGGEIIWQLKDYETFEIWVLPTGNPPEPRNLEERLLKRFYEITGKLPFANRKF